MPNRGPLGLGKMRIELGISSMATIQHVLFLIAIDSEYNVLIRIIREFEIDAARLYRRYRTFDFKRRRKRIADLQDARSARLKRSPEPAEAAGIPVVSDENRVALPTCSAAIWSTVMFFSGNPAASSFLMPLRNP